MRFLRGIVLILLVIESASGPISLAFSRRTESKSSKPTRLSRPSRRLRIAFFGYLFHRKGDYERADSESYRGGGDELSYSPEKYKGGEACMGYLCIRGGAFMQSDDGSPSDLRENSGFDDEDESDRDKEKQLSLNDTATDDETVASSGSSMAESEDGISGAETSALKVRKIFGAKFRRGKRRIKEKWNRTRTQTAAFGKQTIEQWSNWTTSARATAQDRRQFLDRVALVGNALISSEHDAIVSKETDHDDDFMGHDDEITHQSDLTLPGRKIFVVTTAALPWFTGTAVNPLLRAAHLCRKTWEINSGNNTCNVAENESYVRGEYRSMGIKKQWVTLVVPWLELEEDRLELYGPNHLFENQEEQENYIRTWMREEADLVEEADPDTGLRIIFYSARYHEGMKSIFAMGDICSLIPDSEADVCILEEPEHLNWYRAPGDGWTNKFNYVVGVVHTNYKEYASTQYHGLWTAPALGIMSSAMIRAYCHKVIKLSDVLQTFAPEKEKTSNVHGVRSEFLREGMRRATEGNAIEGSNVTVAYFIGKILWAKGLDKMLEMQSFYRQCTGRYFDIDVYGSGPDQKEIMRAFHGRKHHSMKKRHDGASLSHPESLFDSKNSSASVDNVGTEDIFKDSGSDDIDGSDGFSSCDESSSSDEEDTFDMQLQQRLSATREKLANLSQTIKSATDSLEFDLPKTHHELRRTPIPATFPGRIDHALLREQYKVFINPSVTEVLCTTTAEALAMGKFAIIPDHPSNHFFKQFPNCLAYRNKWEFAANLNWALTHDPEPLTPELSFQFTWEAATERFIDAAAITRREAREREQLGTTKLDERIAWFHNELGKGVKGDVLRAMCGGGPISHQVRYETAKKEAELLMVGITEDGMSEPVKKIEEVDQEEGLPLKLRGSSLAEAIRSTFSNLVPLNTGANNRAIEAQG